MVGVWKSRTVIAVMSGVEGKSARNWQYLLANCPFLGMVGISSCVVPIPEPKIDYVRRKVPKNEIFWRNGENLD